MHTYYEVLNVSEHASKSEIRRVFRRLAHKWHPDKNRNPGAEERFKEINEAYQVLSGSVERELPNRKGIKVSLEDFLRVFNTSLDPNRD